MNDNKRNFLDRKDIARMLEISVHQVSYQEKNLGIAPARVNLKTRNVRYHRLLAMKGLERTGNLPKETEE